MNRREFCLVAGLLLAGSARSGAVVPRSVERSQDFRAKKVFLESWDAEIVRDNASFVRKRLGAARNDGCDGLLLFPGRCSTSRWTEQIEPEAARLGLAVLVPARLTGVFFRKARTVVPLAQTNGVLQSFDGIPAEDGGFLLEDKPGGVLGIILYDNIRCRWTGFVPRGIVSESERLEVAGELMAAQWLDRQMHAATK